MTKGKRRLVAGLIGLACLGMGLGLGAFVSAYQRPAAAVALFTDFCLPFAHNEPGPDPAARGLVPIIGPYGAEWGQNGSVLVLTLDDTACTVADTVKPMSLGQVERVQAKVARIVQAEFADLTNQPVTEMGWPIFDIWAQNAPPDRKGTSLMLTRGPGGGMILVVRRAPQT